MVKYNFKSIQVVPKAQEFIDIVLTKTQRKTPTVVHPGYAISKIRQFYLRKIKFTQQLIHDKLTKILTDFPLLDEIHPFYEDLMNVLYDRDHYKLALGQLNTARRLVDTIGRDYLKLMKFGDSLYRCKQLKRAALGRMVKVLRKNGTSFAYLEEVRQHLARLPSIDPNTRTLLVTGYPNVGKSSFMNKITRANVEVQPYAFTTKSLYVGHTDYRFLTWQVIDTPGILDGPLEERNTKEMQSITALAHLKAAILYFIDISEQCGYSIEQQVKLYKSMERLFEGKPIVVVLNKIDVKKPEDLDENQKALIQSIKGDNIEMVPMSNLSEEGISNVKQIACDKIMQQRTETILSSHKNEDILSRVHVAMPVARDDKERPIHVPEVDKEKHNETARRREEEWRLQQRLYKELDPEYKGINWKEDYIVDDPEWKKDRIPEIMDGKNVFDYWSGDVDEKLQEVELEEVARLRSLEELLREDDISQYKLTPEQQEKVRRIREKRKLLIKDSRLRRGVDKPKIPKKYNTKNLTVTDLEAHLESLGMDSSAVAERLRSESRNRSESRGRIRDRISMTREERELSKTPLPGEGYSDLKHKLHAERLARRAMKRLTQDGRMGESDRHQFDWMPKHLFAGKMGAGTKDRR